MSKTIYYNSAVAKRCGRNGIIKAVLIHYLYHYNKFKPREGLGSPACISLPEFVYQYKVTDDKGLWGRSFVHKVLRDLAKDGHLHITRNERMPVYALSQEIIDLIKSSETKTVAFDLNDAFELGIYFAIVARFLMRMIDNSPDRIAYNIDVAEMSETNCISRAQIYRAVKLLIEVNLVKKVRSLKKCHARGLHLSRKMQNV